jgi:hypothetical protein
LQNLPDQSPYPCMQVIISAYKWRLYTNKQGFIYLWKFTYKTADFMRWRSFRCLSNRTVKVKVKFRCGALFSTEALWLIVLLTPKELLHSSVEALHAKRRERP